MNKLLVFVLFSIVLLLCHVPAVSAQNNKYGIHVATVDDLDLQKADELVNSNGGSWGYITVVIQENDRDLNKWQGVFEKLREKRLIPIVRLATKPAGSNWERPDSTDVQDWVQFLNKLKWVVKDRYIILFNEPNHATEWGGSVDSKSFAEINEAFARGLKDANGDFYIMLGGMDASAPSALPRYQDAGIYLRQVVEIIGVEDFNKYFDGLSSHSYPNPAFRGSPLGTGKGSVRTYEWELSLLNELGVKELPVFITETGWDGDALSREEVAENFRIAYQTLWLPDNRVKAVTPFILNYQVEPFLKFSWVKPGGSEVFPEYELVKNLPKEAGRPAIRQSGSFTYDLPREIVAESTYHFELKLQNTGQAIWSVEDDYQIKLTGIPETRYLTSPLGHVKPSQTRTIDIYITTLDEIGPTELKFYLYRGEEAVLASQPWKITVVPLPALDVQASLFPKFTTTDDGFELQLFDEYDELVYKNAGIRLERGIATIDKVENIALGKKYRAVLLKDHYLPRQTHITFTKGTNTIIFESMLPFDFNSDGKLGWEDISGMFSDAGNLRRLFP
ncbi:MAG: hypothetical protein ACEQSA_00365 [Weeksellaceae bacterium]